MAERRISPSFPSISQAAVAMAMLCGLIILPPVAPVVLAATSNRSETPICCAAVACKAANKALDDVSDPVRNTPSQPRNGEKKVNA